MAAFASGAGADWVIDSCVMPLESVDRVELVEVVVVFGLPVNSEQPASARIPAETRRAKERVFMRFRHDAELHSVWPA